jgi:hypothetical protein
MISKDARAHLIVPPKKKCSKILVQASIRGPRRAPVRCHMLEGIEGGQTKTHEEDTLVMYGAASTKKSGVLSPPSTVPS